MRPPVVVLNHHPQRKRESPAAPRPGFLFIALAVKMTFTRDQELAAPIRYIAEYEDGSKHVFQVPQSTLEQGLPSEGRYSIACIVAYEWQQDGYLKPGKIARVYRDNSLPPLSGFHA